MRVALATCLVTRPTYKTPELVVLLGTRSSKALLWVNLTSLKTQLRIEGGEKHDPLDRSTASASQEKLDTLVNDSQFSLLARDQICSGITLSPEGRRGTTHPLTMHASVQV